MKGRARNFVGRVKTAAWKSGVEEGRVGEGYSLPLGVRGSASRKIFQKCWVKICKFEQVLKQVFHI
jgi:hypothetical protein